MGEYFFAMIYLGSVAIKLFAVSVILVGFILATWRYTRRFRLETHEDNFNLLKVELGGALMLALEILVFAEVIETIIVKPGFRPVALLALIILIRTAMSWSLTLQIKGHWPWQLTRKVEGNA